MDDDILNIINQAVVETKIQKEQKESEMNNEEELMGIVNNFARDRQNLKYVVENCIGITAKNARIISTYLGSCANSAFTFSIELDYGMKRQTAGMIDIYEYNKESNSLTSWVGAIPMLARILEIAGVNKWEDLPGRFIRVRASREKVFAIGHITDDKWLDFEAFAKTYRQPER